MKRNHGILRAIAILLACFSIFGCVLSQQNLQPNIMQTSTMIPMSLVNSTPTLKPISVALSPTPFNNLNPTLLISSTSTPVSNILVYEKTTADIPSISLSVILISIFRDKYELVYVDEFGQEIKSIDITESEVLPPESWTANPCQLMNSYWEGSQRENEKFLVEIQDLYSRKIGTYTFLGNQSTMAKKIEAVSPKMQWVALFVNTGDGSETTDEIYDLKMARLRNGVTEPFILLAEMTRSVSAWSINGDYFAYGDRDEQGVSQAWVYQPQKQEKTQLTRFGSEWKNYRLGQLKFSHDSGKLAFTYEYDPKNSGVAGRTQSDFIGVIDLKTKQILGMDLNAIAPIFFTRSKEEIFWDAQSKTLLTRINSINRQDASKVKPIFVWMDALTGKVIHYLQGTEIPGTTDRSSFVWLFPLTYTLDRIAFFRNEYFIVYDWREMNFRAYHYLDPAKEWFFWDYVLPLSGPVNLASCQSLQTSP